MGVHGSVNLGNDPSKQRNCKQFEVLIVFYPVDLMESALSPFFLFVHETQSDYVQGEHVQHCSHTGLCSKSDDEHICLTQTLYCMSLLDVVQAITYLYA